MSMKIYALALATVLALVALAACNGGGGGDGSDGGEVESTPAAEQPSPTVGPPPSPAPEVCPRADDEVVQSLFAALQMEKMSYQQGEPVEMSMRLVNCASTPITRTFPTEQRYEFSVKNEAGDEVWRWSADKAFAEVVGEETYQPSEELTFSETWDQTDNEGQPVGPGSYEVTAESTGCDESMQSCGPRAVLFIEITAS